MDGPPFSIHPDAAKSFDERAEALRALVREFPPESQPDPVAPPVHISAKIGETDIVGEVSQGIMDYGGNVVTRSFRKNGRSYGFTPDDYRSVSALAGSIVKQRDVRHLASKAYVEEKLVAWARRAAAAEEGFCAFLSSSASEDVKRRELLVPIANLQTTEPFRLGNVTIETISKDVIDAWEQSVPVEEAETERSRQLQAYFVGLREKLQGYAAARLEVIAEPKRASEIATETAERTTLYLAMYSVAILVPDVRAASVLRGSEYVRQSTVIELSSGGAPLISSHVLEHAAAMPWLIDARVLADMRSRGFEELSALLRLERLNGFQEAVLNALALYCKAAFTGDPIDKLVYVLASLDSLLLKNQSEPIGQNLRERMAFFLTKDGQERKRIIESVQFAYSLRSNYLHHAETEHEHDRIAEFLAIAAMFYGRVLACANGFMDRLAFIQAIDDVKLGISDADRSPNP